MKKNDLILGFIVFMGKRFIIHSDEPRLNVGMLCVKYGLLEEAQACLLVGLLQAAMI